ncbi:hypothetical protein RvY_07867 [Ramazzottius varieornatus]|uniref:Secreted protein n=1 Tax=Ramazzottius varieornatus TaxID=947166 RepID=A0A1D1V6M3_RAMVA|nr:hypothetical protein RvY_07867 [Ramazzottius varieornatus]
MSSTSVACVLVLYIFYGLCSSSFVPPSTRTCFGVPTDRERYVCSYNCFCDVRNLSSNPHTPSMSSVICRAGLPHSALLLMLQYLGKVDFGGTFDPAAQSSKTARRITIVL